MVDAEAGADERVDGQVRRDVVVPIRVQDSGLAVPLTCKVGDAVGASHARGAEAENGVAAGDAADQVDLAGAIAAFQLNAPVRIDLVAETDEAGPVFFLVKVPLIGSAVGGVDRRIGLDAFRPVVAEVDRPVPTRVLRRRLRRGDDLLSQSGSRQEDFNFIFRALSALYAVR